MTKISLVVPTYRFGGFDVLFGGCKNQTIRDYELIVVDDLYDLRKREVAHYADKLGIPLVHLKPPKSDKPFACCHAINWGLRWAEGNYVMIAQDFIWLKADCFERHLKIQKPEGRVTIGHMHHMVAPKLKHLRGLITVFDRLHEEKPSLLELPERRFTNLAPAPDLGEGYARLTFHFHLTAYSIFPNATVPLHTVIALNGLDERLDIGHGYQEDNLVFRLNLLNHEFVFDKKNVMYHVTHPWSRKEQHPQQANLHYNILNPILQGFVGLKAPNGYDLIQERCRVKFERWVREEGGIETPPKLETYQHPAQQKRLKWIENQCEGVESVLEVGCSSGYVLLNVAKNASKLAGMDINQKVIEENRIMEPEVTWVHGDATDSLPFPNSSYDCLLCTEILEHIPFAKASPLIMEALRVAKKRVLITIPNATIPKYNRKWVESPHHRWALTTDRLHALTLTFLTGLWNPKPNFTLTIRYLLDDNFCYIAAEKGGEEGKDEVFGRAVQLKEMKEREAQKLRGG